MDLRTSAAIGIAVGLMAGAQTAGLAQSEARNVPVVTGPASVTQVVAGRSYLAWAQASADRPGHSDVYVKARGGSGERIRVNGAGSEGSLGAIDGRRLVYQQFTGSVDDGSSSIRIVNLATGNRRVPGAVNSRHWDFWPALDGRWLLHGRTNAATDKTKVLLTDLRSGKTRTLDKWDASAYMQPGQVNGNYAVWMRWKSGGKGRVFLYNIKTRNRIAVPTGDKWNWGPSVTKDGTVYFGRSGRICGENVKLLRWSKGSGTTRVLDFPAGVDTGDSYVARNSDGELEVYYTRVVCEPNFEGDGYKLVFPAGPRPSPSPTSPSPSPSPEGPTLEVEIAGEGTVTSDPDGIDCGSDCEESFETGTEITLTATADQGSRIWDWSHPDCGHRDTTCTFDMGEDDLTVTVTFR